MIRNSPSSEAIDFIGQKASDYQWRATERKLGSIAGIKNNVILIASDGNLGVFTDSKGRMFLGHVQMFSGRVRTPKTV
jgi:hypothetical protein